MTTEEKMALLNGILQGANMEHAQINLILAEGATISYSNNQTNDNKSTNTSYKLNQSQLLSGIDSNLSQPKSGNDKPSQVKEKSVAGLQKIADLRRFLSPEADLRRR